MGTLCMRQLAGDSNLLIKKNPTAKTKPRESVNISTSSRAVNIGQGWGLPVFVKSGEHVLSSGYWRRFLRFPVMFAVPGRTCIQPVIHLVLPHVVGRR